MPVTSQPARFSSSVPTRLEIALSRSVVLRALGYLVVVGGLLVAINHGDAILAGDIDSTRAIKILVTPFVPYVVSTLSSVSARRAAAAGRE